MSRIKDILEINPIIGAIKNKDTMDRVISSDCEIVFLLQGDIVSIKKEINILQKENKKVFVHVDMISGISSSTIIVDFFKKEFKDVGIITTKTNIVKRAIEIDVDVVQRFFFIDSISLDNAIESLKKIKPKAIEIMPGIMPKVVKKINKIYPDIPIICGGLINEKDEIIAALSAGAMAVSTSDYKKW